MLYLSAGVDLKIASYIQKQKNFAVKMSVTSNIDSYSRKLCCHFNEGKPKC